MGEPLKVVNTEQSESSVLLIKCDRIIPMEGQPRTIFDEKTVEALANEIQVDGQVTPIEVEKLNNRPGIFEICDGERRWRAGKIIQQRTGKPFLMRCVVTVVKDRKEKFRRSAIANFHREDMHPLDIARTLKKIQEDEGYSNARLGEMWGGKSYTTVRNYLSLNELSADVKELMIPKKGREEGLLSLTHAFAVAEVPDHTLQFELAREVIEGGLGIAEARHHIAVRANKYGHTVGSVTRKPSDDYRVFTNFLSATESGLTRYGRLDFDALYYHRDFGKDDRNRHIAKLKQVQKLLNALTEKIEESSAD